MTSDARPRPTWPTTLKCHVIEAVLHNQSGHRRGVAAYTIAQPITVKCRALRIWADHLKSIEEVGARNVP
jgi:hypothetical protein